MATSDLNSGKKMRFIPKHHYLDGKPRLIVFGHSMPKRLFRHFDQNLLPVDSLYQFGEVTREQAYAAYLGVEHLYGEIEFVHCSGIFHELCFKKLCMIRDLKPECV